MEINNRENTQTFIQSYLNTYDPQNGTTPTAIVDSNIDDVDNGVSYYVDEKGQYYYQTAKESLVSIANEVSEKNLGQDYQTVVLPANTGNDEVAYVLIAQDDVAVINNDVNTADENDNNIKSFGNEELMGRNSKITKLNVKPFRKEKVLPQIPYPCTYCNYTSYRRYLLVRHMKTHSEDKPHKCAECERAFKTLTALQNHMNGHNGVKPHICKQCEGTFTTSGELRRHMKYRHTLEKPHKCKECDYASVELSKLKRHVRCHTGERPHQCPHCNYASQDTFKLKRHLRTHKGEKPFECEYCHMFFSQFTSLKIHMVLIHTDSEDTVYKCEHCSFNCTRKAVLRMHIDKQHKSIRRIKCRKCRKLLLQKKSNKVDDKKTHEEDKTFNCDLCPYESSSHHRLGTHMLTHLDDKPHICDNCDECSEPNQLPEEHQTLNQDLSYKSGILNETTYSCHECNLTFAHKDSLIQHISIHDLNSGYQDVDMTLNFDQQEAINVTSLNSTKIPHIMRTDGKSEVTYQLSNNEIVTMEGDNGEQYVVLDVIPLEGDSGQQFTDMPDMKIKINNAEQIVPSNVDNCYNLEEEIYGTSDFKQHQDIDYMQEKELGYNERVKENVKINNVEHIVQTNIEQCYNLEDKVQANFEFNEQEDDYLQKQELGYNDGVEMNVQKNNVEQIVKTNVDQCYNLEEELCASFEFNEQANDFLQKQDLEYNDGVEMNVQINNVEQIVQTNVEQCYNLEDEIRATFEFNKQEDDYLQKQELGYNDGVEMNVQKNNVEQMVQRDVDQCYNLEEELFASFEFNEERNNYFQDQEIGYNDRVEMNVEMNNIVQSVQTNVDQCYNLDDELCASFDFNEQGNDYFQEQELGYNGGVEMNVQMNNIEQSVQTNVDQCYNLENELHASFEYNELGNDFFQEQELGYNDRVEMNVQINNIEQTNMDQCYNLVDEICASFEFNEQENDYFQEQELGYNDRVELHMF